MKQYTQQTFSLYLAAILALIIFSSCGEKFFDQQPGDKIKPEQHFKSTVEVYRSYYGAFSMLQEVSEDLVVSNGLLSDMMEINENASSDMYDLYNHEIDAGNEFVNSSDYYKIAVNTNEILKHLYEVQQYDKDFDSLETVTAESFLVSYRAWAYFTLARYFGKVNYLPDNLENYSEGNDFQEYERKEIIQKLIDELRPYTIEPVYNIIGTPVFSPMALMAEMFLELDQYDSAWYYAKYAIDGIEINRDVYKLDDEFAEENWINIFIGSTGNHSTVYTAVLQSLDYKQPNMLEYYFISEYSIKPTRFIIDGFESQLQYGSEEDPGDIYRGAGISYDTIDASTPFITKYSHSVGLPYSSDNIILRAADVHLILCEALNRMGETADAHIFLNRGYSDQKPSYGRYVGWNNNLGVRGRVNLEVTPETASITEMEDYIINERALELAFEGKRWFDLIRIARRRDDPAYLADKVAAKYSDPEVAARVRAKLMNPENWYLPVDY